MTGEDDDTLWPDDAAIMRRLWRAEIEMHILERTMVGYFFGGLCMGVGAAALLVQWQAPRLVTVVMAMVSAVVCIAFLAAGQILTRRLPK